MNTETISLLANLATVLVVLTLGTRIGYILANRGTARDMEMIERHFESTLRITERQQELRFEEDRRRRAHEEMKNSYDQLGIWLHTLSRTFDEMKAGALSSHKQTEDKIRLLLQQPLTVIYTPTSLASSVFYWSSEVRTLIRKIEGPYSIFVHRVQMEMDTKRESESEELEFTPEKVWEARNNLHLAIRDIEDQVRIDLGVSRIMHG